MNVPQHLQSSFFEGITGPPTPPLKYPRGPSWGIGMPTGCRAPGIYTQPG